MALPERKIFDSTPASWQELEKWVAQVFQEMGCRVGLRQVIPIPRGSVEVDVAVRDETVVPHSLYICECKHWTKRVSQSEIHAFRTVVQEVGANRGFLISKIGFQRGAVEAAAFTNLDLLTWPQFESMMFERWVTGAMNRLHPLFLYASKLISTTDDELWEMRECTDESWKELEVITQRHLLVLSWTLFTTAKPTASLTWLAASLVEMAPVSAVSGEPINSYRKLINEAASNCWKAIAELEAFWGIKDDEQENPLPKRGGFVPGGWSHS